MNSQEVRDLFDYLAGTRDRFLEKGREVGWTEFTKPREASWGSMLDIFVHMLDVEEGWLQIATRGGSLAETPDRKPNDYADFEQVRQDHEKVTALTRSRLENLTDAELARRVEFRWPEEVSRTFEKIAMHAFVDELAHVGELVCLLWQIDVKPPFQDWIDFRAR